MGRLKLAGLALALALAALTPTESAAQRIVGDIVDPTTGAPVVGAFVRLFDASGALVRGVLSDADGRFIVEANSAGRYTIMVERIGHMTIEDGPFDLQADETRPLRLQSAPRAIALEGLEVEGRGRCTVRPDRAAVVATVWEEARKALELTLWSRDNSQIQFRSTLFARHYDATRSRMIDETIVPSRGAGPKPFRTPPPGVLTTQGFAISDGDSITYYGPDAEILLSDEFLDHHCFELDLDAPSPDLVGLRFRPARNRSLPDITGTLWIERATGMLRWIDYRYVSIERLLPVDRIVESATAPRTPRAEVTGRTEFRRLDNGIWIVDSWWIRMPLLGRRGRNLNLVGWREQGAVVLEARPIVSINLRIGRRPEAPAFPSAAKAAATPSPRPISPHEFGRSPKPQRPQYFFLDTPIRRCVPSSTAAMWLAVHLS